MQFLYQGVLMSTLLVSQRTRCSVSSMMKRCSGGGSGGETQEQSETGAALTATETQVCGGYLEDDQEEVLLLALGRLHLLLQPLDLLLQLAFLVLAGLVHVLVVAAVPLWRQMCHCNQTSVLDGLTPPPFTISPAGCSIFHASQAQQWQQVKLFFQLLPVKPPPAEYIRST